jgi:hypothetical protein
VSAKSGEAQACAGCRIRSLCTADLRGRGIDIGPYSEAIAQHRAKMRDPALRAQSPSILTKSDSAMASIS